MKPRYAMDRRGFFPVRGGCVVACSRAVSTSEGDLPERDRTQSVLLVTLPRGGSDLDRVKSRSDFPSCLGLLDQLSRGLGGFPSNEAASLPEQQDIAYQILTSGKVVEASEIGCEPEEVRDRYGRNKFGQSLLLSKRLIEVGVPIVQATIGIVQTRDTHVDNWSWLKNTFLPQLDQGLAALMDDLASSGMIVAAYPVTRSFSPADVCSTLFNSLGGNYEVTITDPLQRPQYLLYGNVISPLYTGRTT